MPPSVHAVGTASSGAANVTLTLPTPSGYGANDGWLIAVENDYQNTIPIPIGAALIGYSESSVVAGASTLSVWWRRASYSTRATWSTVSSGTSTALRDVVHGLASDSNYYFVAVGDNGTVRYSNIGAVGTNLPTTWSGLTVGGSTYQWEAVRFINNRFFAVGRDTSSGLGAWAWSSNPTTGWTTGTIANTTRLTGIDWNGTYYAASCLGTVNGLQYSTNLSTWTGVNIGEPCYDVLEEGGYWFLASVASSTSTRLWRVAGATPTGFSALVSVTSSNLLSFASLQSGKINYAANSPIGIYGDTDSTLVYWRRGSSSAGQTVTAFTVGGGGNPIRSNETTSSALVSGKICFGNYEIVGTAGNDVFIGNPSNGTGGNTAIGTGNTWTGICYSPQNGRYLTVNTTGGVAYTNTAQNTMLFLDVGDHLYINSIAFKQVLDSYTPWYSFGASNFFGSGVVNNTFTAANLNSLGYPYAALVNVVANSRDANSSTDFSLALYNGSPGGGSMTIQTQGIVNTGNGGGLAIATADYLPTTAVNGRSAGTIDNMNITAALSAYFASWSGALIGRTPQTVTGAATLNASGNISVLDALVTRRFDGWGSPIF